MPTEANARSYSETRLQPLFESSDELRALKQKDADKFKHLEWQLTTSTVNLVGANSPANLASRPVSLLLCDEVDKWPETGSGGKEAGAIDLAVERTKSFLTSKRFYTSTPTTSNAAIARLYNKGDKRVFKVPCPHCENRITLEFPHVKWDEEAKNKESEQWDFKRVASSAYYECQVCGGKILDAHKTKMLRAGEWHPTNPDAMPGWRSYHLSSLYSVFLPFGKIAVKFLDGKHSNSGLQNFVNSYLAEVWEERGIEIKEEKLIPLLGENERGTFKAEDGGYNLMAVDVQRSHLVWVVRRFRKGMQSELVDWGFCPWYNDLDEIAAGYGVRFVAIDSGYGERTQQVYNAVAERRNTWIAVKGQAKMSEFFRHTQIDPFTGSKNAGLTKISLLHINDPVWSEELLARLSGKVGGWKLTKSLDPIYTKQILAMSKIEKKKRNGTVEVELRGRGEWDIWDAEKYLLALASMLGLGRGEQAGGTAPAKSGGGLRVVGSFA